MPSIAARAAVGTGRQRAASVAAAAALAVAGCHRAPVTVLPSSADSTAIRRDVAYLSSDALAGRGTGTPGFDSAAAFVARRYAALRLEPAGGPCAPSAQPCPSPYLQPFTARSVQAAHAGLPRAIPAQNVVAILRGADPALREEYVVVGAHLDHLGRETTGALDPSASDAIRNGADDNASGSAAVLELARLLVKRPPRRSVVFVNFSGEELGLLGSQHFVEHSPVPLDHMAAMLNFDMVGRLRDDKLIVYGTATAAELPAILDSANVAPRLSVRAMGDGFGPSDHSSFYGKNVPVLHFFTDLHDDYHRATDDVERINGGGAARVVDFAERVVRAIADRPTRLTFVRGAPAAMTSSARPGRDTYLGSIPDMGAADVRGVRVSGVGPGSPGERAGLEAGDVIVEFGGRPVKDLYEYTDALYSFKPGDKVQIVVERSGKRLTLTATLGRRGG